MSAPKGNKFWEARTSHGRKPIYDGDNAADQLWADCVEYFEWVEENPLYAADLVKYQGDAKVEYQPRMRAMTIVGLCNFIGIPQKTWIVWRKNRKDLGLVIARAEDIITQQKFEGASADLLNARIISRDLGLADKHEVTGAEGGPIKSESKAVVANVESDKLEALLDAIDGDDG